MPETDTDIPIKDRQADIPENNRKVIVVDPYVWYMVALFIFSGLCILLFSIFEDKSFEEIERNTIVALMSTGLVIYMVIDARNSHSLKYDNEKHIIRFAVVYGGCIILACVFAMIPSSMWPYTAIFVMLLFFSNAQTALVSGAVLLMLSELLNQEMCSSEFFMYLLAGMIAVIMFQKVDGNFQTGVPIFVTIVMLFVLQSSFEVLFNTGRFRISFFSGSFMNIIFTLILIFAILNITGKYVINAGYDRYMDINDPGFELMMDIREKNDIEFYRAMHTAYLTDKISKEMKLNSFKCKTCAYYHRLGCIDGYTYDSAIEKYWKYDFPHDSIDLIEEYNMINRKGVISREAAVVYLSESLIISIMYIIHKNKDVKIDYDELIDKTLMKKIESGILNHCEFSMAELTKIKKVMKREKLYYEFMR